MNQINQMVVNQEIETKTEVKPIEDVTLLQTQAHSSRTEKYQVVRTSEIINAFVNKGYTWELVKKTKARKQSKKGYEAHMIYFEKQSLSLGDETLDQEVKPRIYLRNSHDGTTVCEFTIGLFRFVCENGLFIGTMFDSIKLKHIGSVQERVDQAIAKMEQEYESNIGAKVRTLKETVLTNEQINAYAETMLRQRMRNSPSFMHGEHEMLLKVNPNRVKEDSGNSAWSVIQRVQDNLGLNFGRSPVELTCYHSGLDKDNKEVIKERKLRRISSIKEVTELNQFVFKAMEDIIK